MTSEFKCCLLSNTKIKILILGNLKNAAEALDQISLGKRSLSLLHV